MLKSYRLTILAALAAFALCCAAESRAQSSAADGQSFGKNIAPWLMGGVLRADSTSKALTMSSTGAVSTTESAPLNGSTNYGVGTSLMSSDTMSVNGRTMDSTSVFPCAAYGIITASFKMDGHHDAVGKIVRIAIIPIWSNSATASDTTLTTAGGLGGLMIGGAGTSTVGTFSPDSLGPTADATAHTALPGVETLLRFLNRSIISENSLSYRTMTLSYRNPGYQYVRFITRVLSDTGTAATQGFQFKLSVTASGRAL